MTDFSGTLFDGIELTDYQTLLDQNMLLSFTPAGTEEPLHSERYELQSQLGEGSMGQILLAKDKFLFRRVAYKHIRSELAHQPKLINAFYKEAQITSQLEHPGIVPVYSMEQPSDRSLAYAMKWLRGQTLRQEITAFRTQLAQGLNLAEWEKGYRRLLGIFLSICDTLHFAHQKGVIHRDLKPTNIMLGAYHEVYVLDWGIATLMHALDQAELEPDTAQSAVVLQAWATDLEERTQLGAVVGTPRYMSPEQACGAVTALQPSSDIFSLGLILFELTYLQPAFQGETVQAVLAAVKQNQQSAPKAAYKAVRPHPVMSKIIAKATATEPAQRYASAADLALEIRAYLADQATQVLPDKLVSKSLRWTRHHPQQTLSLMLVLILLSLAAVAASLSLSQQAIQQTRLRRLALNRLLTETTLAASRLDSQLNHYESALERLSASAVEAYQRGSARGVVPLQAVRSSPDFEQASWLPEQKQIPPRLWPLLDSAQTFFALTLDASADPQQSLKQNQLAQSPVQSLDLGFVSGEQLHYPGAVSAAPQPLPPPDQIQAAYAPTWGQVQAEQIPLYQALYTEQGTYLGWASAQMKLSALKQELQVPDLPGFVSLQLLAPQGQGLAARLPQLELGASGPLPEAVTQALQQQHTYFEYQGQIYAFQQLAALPWYLVLEVQLQALLEASQDVLD